MSYLKILISFSFLGLFGLTCVDAKDNLFLTQKKSLLEPIYSSSSIFTAYPKTNAVESLVNRFIADLEFKEVATEKKNNPYDLNEIALIAMSYVGVKYKWGGVDPKEGFDCSGFVQYFYANDLNKEIPRSLILQKDYGIKIDREDLRTGDLVFFNTRKRKFSHVGIYIGDSKFLHSPRSGKSVLIEDMKKRYWQKRYNGARRIPTDVIAKASY